ncbi:glycosyltransferase family 25 protein [Aureimonas jatrophae]|uniref:Glycosyl transferase, family 25 n=1 Tax=Aureimonas jatrophae TaxID=1166073 RepID=A0A1H0LI93_9HYPH|nr:glycosyltransferase family 25 protein [Aureimonas jatrophae]MBB3952526.1 glycosyl transferase family 25 [Aureimonas jatrophae]SDO67775.1 glycosyl transferase, family 25 [Aureimonas jatrophae]
MEPVPIRVINLDRATARLDFMARQLGGLGLAFERRRAVETADIAPDLERRINHRWERPLSGPELGCLLSHVAIWREVAAGTGPVLVLEDDAVLSCRLPEALAALSRLDAEMVNIETFGRRRFVARRSVAVGEGLWVRQTRRDKSGSAAYLLWPAGARRLLASFEARGAAPADAFLFTCPGLRLFQVEPALAIQAHLFAALTGRAAGVDGATMIHQPRARLPVSRANLPFLARRIAAQVRLLAHHAARLGPATYRRTPVEAADFPDQSRS